MIKVNIFQIMECLKKENKNKYMRFFELNSIESIEFVEYNFQLFSHSELLIIVFSRIYRI